jgi:hypothetical protein
VPPPKMVVGVEGSVRMAHGGPVSGGARSRDAGNRQSRGSPLREWPTRSPRTPFFCVVKVEG